MIGFFCPYCKKALQLPEEQAGTRVDCPQCSLQIRVPAPAHAEVARSASPAIQPASPGSGLAADASGSRSSGSWWSRVKRLART